MTTSTLAPSSQTTLISTSFLRAILLGLICLFSIPSVAQVTTYNSFAEFNEKAQNGEQVYVDATFYVVLQRSGFLLVDIENPEEKIFLKNALGLNSGKTYHGIYGKVTKVADTEFYIWNSSTSGTDYTSLIPQENVPSVYVFPLVISDNNLTYDNLNAYVTATGYISINSVETTQAKLTTQSGQVICINRLSSLSSFPVGKKTTVVGLIGTVEYLTKVAGQGNENNPQVGILVSEIWKEGEEPERSVKVMLSQNDENKGVVTVAEAGQEAVGAEATIKDGHTAILTATPASGYEFKEWTLNGQTYSTESSLEWTVIGNAAFEAHFTKSAVPKYTISVASNDETLGEAEVVAATSMPVEEGTDVILKATPKEGARFVCWTDEDGIEVSTASQCQVTVKTDQTYTANFVAIGTVSVTIVGEGTVTLSQNGNLIAENTLVDNGSVLIINASPAEGWELKDIKAGNSIFNTSPAEITVSLLAEVQVTFEKLPEPEPEPIPESVTTVEDLRKYAADGVEMTITVPLTVVAQLIVGGSEFVATDGDNVVICKTSSTTGHPGLYSVIKGVKGTFTDMGSGVLYFKISNFEAGTAEEASAITPIETTVADVMSKTGEYVSIANVRLGPTTGSTQSNRSYLFVYGKINSNDEPPVKAYYYGGEVCPEILDENTYYTVKGVIGDFCGEKMLLLTEPPVLQAQLELPTITLSASPANSGKVWLEINGENKGNRAQVAKSTAIILHAEAAEGMEFVGWIPTGTNDEPTGEAVRQITVDNTASYTAVFRAKSTTPENPRPDDTDPETPTAKSYKVTFSATDNGTLTVTSPTGPISSGTMVEDATLLTITASAAEGYQLAELKVNGTSRLTDNNGTCTLKISANTVIEAIFTRFIASARQLRVAIDDWIEGVEMGKVYIDKPGTTYIESKMLEDHTFHAEPAPDCKFVGWSIPGTNSPFNTSPVFTYNVRDALTLVAEFAYIIPAPRSIELRVSSPEKGNVAIKEFDSKRATTRRYVTLSAVPSAANHHFRDWTDADGNVVSTEAEFIYTSATPVILTANFTSTYSLSLTAEGGGTLTWKAEVENDAESLPENTRVTLTATPEPHHELSTLTVNGTDMTGKYLESENGLTIVMNGDKDVKAKFTPVYYPVSIATHAHGRIEVVRGVNADGTPGGGKVVHGDRARFGDVLHIYPVAAEGYRLKEIRVNDAIADHDAVKGYAAHSVEGPAAITADFEMIPSGIGSVEADDDPDTPVYDLQGRPAGSISTARSGLYLVRRATGWAKILISR